MSSKILFFSLFFLVGASAVSMDTTIYEVGGVVDGWNNSGTTNYTEWASTKQFQLYDSLVFSYNSSISDVYKVKEEQFGECSDVDPIATYSSGNDEVILDHVGYHYFICSHLVMCEAGQKLKVYVGDYPTPPAPAQTYPGTDMPVDGDYPVGWKPKSSSSVCSYNASFVLLIIFVSLFLYYYY